MNRPRKIIRLTSISKLQQQTKKHASSHSSAGTRHAVHRLNPGGETVEGWVQQAEQS